MLNIPKGTVAKIPFKLVDSTDGKTAETGLTFSSSQIVIRKSDATSGNFAGSVAELANGLYIYTSTVGETSVLGFLVIDIQKTGCRPFHGLVQVVENDPFEAVTVLASGSTTTSFSVSSCNGGVDDFYNGSVLAFKNGNLAPTARKVTGFVASTKTYTFTDAFPAAPSTDSEAIIVGRIE